LSRRKEAESEAAAERNVEKEEHNFSPPITNWSTKHQGKSLDPLAHLPSKGEI